MFVHEYSDKEFESYEDCRDDLMGQIDSNDIVQHFEYSTSTLIFKFLNRKSDQDFLQWLEQEIEEAYERTLDELITEYEEGDVGDE
jgi:hypothetical protein